MPLKRYTSRQRAERIAKKKKEQHNKYLYDSKSKYTDFVGNKSKYNSKGDIDGRNSKAIEDAKKGKVGRTKEGRNVYRKLKAKYKDYKREKELKKLEEALLEEIGKEPENTDDDILEAQDNRI